MSEKGSSQETNRITKGIKNLAARALTPELEEMHAALKRQEVFGEDLSGYQQAANEELREKSANSSRDFLTGLWNREGFEKLVLERQSKLKERAVLLFLDTDHFKNINDTYGHGAGDLVLRAASRELEKVFRSQFTEIRGNPEDIIARYGGDEFMVYLPGANTTEDVMKRLSKTADGKEVAQISFTVYVENPASPTKEIVPINVSFSGGVSDFYPTGDIATYLNDTIKETDQLLYQAKKNGRNQLVKKSL